MELNNGDGYGIFSANEAITGILAAVSAVVGWLVKRILIQFDQKFTQIDAHIEATDKELANLNTKVAVLEAKRY
jgi:hypothetical protein